MIEKIEKEKSIFLRFPFIIAQHLNKSPTKMSGTEIRAGVHAPHEDVAKSSVDYPAIKVRHASYEKIEKRALIHQQDSGDITKDFLVRSTFVFRNVLPKQF